MSAYELIKLLIKHNRKTKEELTAYCDAYLATGKLSEDEYEELLGYLI